MRRYALKNPRWLFYLCVLAFLTHVFAAGAAAIPVAEATANLSLAYTLTAAPGTETFSLKFNDIKSYAFGSIETSFSYDFLTGEFDEESGGVSALFEEGISGSRIEARSPFTELPLSLYSYSKARSADGGKVIAQSAAGYSASFTSLGSGTLNLSLLFDALVDLRTSGPSEPVNGEAGYQVILDIEGDGRAPVLLSGGTGLVENGNLDKWTNPYQEAIEEALALADGQAGTIQLLAYTSADPPPGGSSVPEPMTVLLLGLGLLGIAILTTRKSGLFSRN